MADILKQVADIDGWLTKVEAKCLYDLASKCQGKGVIVEIGSWKGKSTVCLAQGSKDGAGVKVFAIDPHTGSPEHQAGSEGVWTFVEFQNNVKQAGVADLIEPIIKTSQEAAANFSDSVELIFIDGAHEYEAVKADFNLWLPKVIDGGMMAFHDSTSWPGVKQVVDNFVYRSKIFKNVKFINSITFAEKVSQNSFLDRRRNLLIFWLKRIYELWLELKIVIKRFIKLFVKI